ncbi:hypothetical protein E4U54_005181, partial [Claviceps lovelessii]
MVSEVVNVQPAPGGEKSNDLAHRHPSQDAPCPQIPANEGLNVSRRHQRFWGQSPRVRHGSGLTGPGRPAETNQDDMKVEAEAAPMYRCTTATLRSDPSGRSSPKPTMPSRQGGPKNRGPGRGTWEAVARGAGSEGAGTREARRHAGDEDWL